MSIQEGVLRVPPAVVTGLLAANLPADAEIIDAGYDCVTKAVTLRYRSGLFPDSPIGIETYIRTATTTTTTRPE